MDPIYIGLIVGMSIQLILNFIIGHYLIRKRSSKHIEEIEKERDDLEHSQAILKIQIEKNKLNSKEKENELMKKAYSEINQYRSEEFKKIEETRQIMFDEIEENAKRLRNEKQKTAMEHEKELAMRIEKEFELKREKQQRDFEEAKKELNLLLKDTQESVESQIEILKSQISDLESIEDSAIKARIRRLEESDFEGFHSISVKENERVQIQGLLKAVGSIPGDKIKIAINHLIFDYFYRNPINSMIQRVCQGRRIQGIYKITYIPTGQCYVGQSVDIGNRWLTHCKRGSGIDNSVTNKLYPAMLEHGIYNFTFEILEELEDSARLTPQEKYWAKYFGAKVFGYSIRN